MRGWKLNVKYMQIAEQDSREVLFFIEAFTPDQYFHWHFKVNVKLSEGSQTRQQREHRGLNGI